jgi:[ribosomal protein S18]-alanine N-acetyltransferase
MYYFIEPMTEEDIPQVQEIEAKSFSTPWSTNTYKRELRTTATCRYVVARASATPPPPRSNDQHRSRRPNILVNLFAGLFANEAQTLAPDPLVGYGGVWLTVDHAHITTIAVDPPHRGKGVGELLLNALIDHAYELQARMLTLEVRVSNVAAQKLYLKYGFEPGGKRPRYYTDNGEDALIMWTEEINNAAFQERLGELRKRLYERLQKQTRA